MYNEYGMSEVARLHLDGLRREAAEDRLAAACRKPRRRRAAVKYEAAVAPVTRRRWRGRLGWLFRY